MSLSKTAPARPATAPARRALRQSARRPITDPDTPREKANGRTGWWIAAFLTPFLLLYLGFTLWPLAATAYYSLFNWSGTGPVSDYVGAGNYRAILNDPLFWKSFVNTLLFAVGTTVIKVPLSLAAAVLLTRKWLRGKRIFRTVFFVPLILPVPLAGLVFTYLLNPSNGAFGAVLNDLGIGSGHTDVFSSRWSSMLALILISVWQVFGQYMIYWMAALQNVPEEVYEAAELDGANEWQKLTRITLPMIRPVAVVIVMLALVNALHVFGLVVTLTAGGPGTSTYVVPYFIYEQAFGSVPFAYGYASAAALLFAGMAFALVMGQGYFVRRAQQTRKEYGI